MDSDLNKRFISFEKDSGLFELKDNNDIYVWDIIRFDIYVKLMWNCKLIPSSKKHYGFAFLSFLKKVRKLLAYFLDNRKYSNFFYINSRNVLEGELFDQNAHSVIKNFPLTDSLLFETNLSVSHPLVFKQAYYNLPQLFFRRFYKSKSSFDYEPVIQKVTEEFGQCPLSVSELELLVNNFYSDFYFFRQLFKRKQLKRVFITQNGIQKGLFAAANSLNIPTYEFQHGIVDEGHLAYNYPDLSFNPRQLYLPNVIFSLSSYWFNNLNLPDVKVIALGNDFFSRQTSGSRNDETAITIVCADVFGTLLEQFLLLNIKEVGIVDEKVFFKLHPNQFDQKNYYQRKFSQFPNVEVITNEFSINELLEKSSTLLTIQSTAVYEALQAGKKVILLKESSYRRHYDLFSNPNLYLVGNLSDLREALGSTTRDVPETEFFSKYNPEILLKTINI